MRRIGIVIALLAASTVRAGDADTKQTIVYVRKLQTEAGSFLAQAPKPKEEAMPTLRATSAAVRALRYLGGEIKDADAAGKFVASCYDPQTGGFSDVPKGKPGVFETAVGLMAVAELKLPVEKFGGAAKYLAEHAKSFEEIRIAAAGMEAIKKESPQRQAWVAETNKYALLTPPADARNLASVLVTQMRLGQEIARPEMPLKVLNDGQRKSGGWGKAGELALEADLETTYRVMRCFMMLKARPERADAVRQFVAKCRNTDGGYGVAPGQPSTVNATYFAAIITHWLDEKK